MPADDLPAILVPLPRRAFSDTVVVRLREAILHGGLAPGEVLRENQLAESLGVSRGPVREALNRLETEGLIIQRPGRRAVVARLSRKDLDEVFSVRLALERLAVQLACTTPSETGLEEMQAVVDQMARAMAGEATARLASELDLSFHDVLYHMSAHQRLIAFWTQLKPQVQVFLLSRNVAAPDFREFAVKGHQEILDALKARNEGRALDIIEKHLQVGYQRLLSSYE